MKSSLLAASLFLALAPLAAPAFAQETRTVTDLVGEVVVPAHPQRVVVTDGDSILEPTVALGIKPVGASVNAVTGAYSSVVKQRLPADIGFIGPTREPNYEAVLLMEPDLILMTNDDLPDERGMYDRFTAIAPTVLVNQDQVLWKQALLDVAKATGRESEAAELLARYDARIAEVRAKIGDRAGTASVVRLRSDHVRYMAQDSSFVWDILKSLGFRAPEAQDRASPSAFVRVSLERLDVLNAELILVLEDAGALGTNGMKEQVEALPAYRNLSPDRIHLATAEYIFGNILTAFEILDILEDHYS